MARRPRIDPAAVLFALLGLALLAWLGLKTFAFSDYEKEAFPAYSALVHGHVADFLSRLPAYGGSLVMRAPFALLPGVWGGGDDAVFRAVAAPCLVALGLLALWVDHALRSRGASRPARLLSVALCAASPVALRALEIGHPEEILGAVLCVAALLAAQRSRPGLAGVALGLAVANKPWALVAVAPVLAAAPGGRLRLALVAAGVGGAVLGPLVAHTSGVAAQTHVAAQTGSIFQPWQVWWFFGGHGHIVRGLYGVHEGYRAAPGWLSGLPHPFIVAASPVLTVAWLRVRSGSGRRPDDVLLLAALLFLLRCVLDPWNNVYYALPFVLTLLAWEVVRRPGIPLVTLGVTGAQWVSFELLHTAPDVTAAVYLAWVVPLAGVLTQRVFAPARAARFAEAVRRRLEHALPTLVRPRPAHVLIDGPAG